MTKNNSDSIFESYTFSFAKWLYNRYGISTTCNVLFSDGFNCLKNVTDKYKAQFENNKEWLKFSFHGYDYWKNYAKTKYDEAKNDFVLVTDELKRICGDIPIEPIMRIHFFSGSEEAINAWSWYKKGFTLFFCADDDRSSYDLTEDEEKYCRNSIYLRNNKQAFLKTDIRLENFKVENVSKYIDEYQKEYMVIFTHETFINKIEIKNKISMILDEINKKEIVLVDNIKGMGK